MEELRHEQAALVLAASDGSLVTRVKRVLVGGHRVSAAGAVISTAVMLATLLSASTIFGKALQPNELWWQVQQTRPAVASVYDAMGLESDSTAFLEPLSRAVASDKPTDEQLEAFVAACDQGARYDALAQQILPLMHVVDHWAQDHGPGTVYGSQFRRLALCERLWNKSLAFAKSDPDRARRYARASFLLSGQDTLLFGGRLIGRLDSNPGFSEIAQINERQRERLRLALLADIDASNQYVTLMSSVRNAINQRLLHPELPPLLSLEECASRIRQCTPFCEKERYHVQRDLAKLIWMLRTCDRSLALQTYSDLKRAPFGPYWQRWLDEAADAPKDYWPTIPKPATKPSTRPVS
jgi:hypothetical protein